MHLLAIYCVLILMASLLGGHLPSRFRLTHTGLQFVLSLVGGLMLGIGLLHLIPHSYVTCRSIDWTARWTLIGLLAMFFLIRAFHFHHHGPASDHGHDCDHHDHADSLNQLSWVGVAFGLSLHTLIDGIALGASASATHPHSDGSLPGLGVFLAILAHKPLDALSITTMMLASGWSIRSRQLINLGFALMCPLGAFIAWYGIDRYAGQRADLLGAALAFSAGVFLCISLGDLLPEVQFHTHDRVKLSAALLLGIAIAYGITFLEPGAHGTMVPLPFVPAAPIIGTPPI